MPVIEIREQSLELCGVCPYCTRHYICTSVVKRDGVDVRVPDPRKLPSNCERCGSPMEPGKEAQKFQNDMAAKAKNDYGPGVGKLMELTPVSDDDNRE